MPPPTFRGADMGGGDIVARNTKAMARCWLGPVGSRPLGPLGGLPSRPGSASPRSQERPPGLPQAPHVQRASEPV